MTPRSAWSTWARLLAKCRKPLTKLPLRTVIVLNDSDGHSDKRARSTLAQQFIGRGQTAVDVPFDPHLRPGGIVDVQSELGRPTRRKFLQITAVIAGFFAARPDTPPDRRTDSRGPAQT
jgi:MinD-like ATPase involved in chromosome partitioning or flagellar assembly